MCHYVMELHKGILGASATVAGHKRTPSLIAMPNHASDLGRDMPGAVSCPPADSRVVRGGELLLGEILKQRREGPIEDLTEITIWNLVTQESLGLPDLLVQCCAARELYLILLGRERGDDRPTRWGRHDLCGGPARD